MQVGTTLPLRIVTGVLISLLAVQLFAPTQVDAAQDGPPDVVYFPVTGHHVAEPFLSTWREHGGLPIFGYPLSELIDVDGMQVQYFERARFEYHPENAGTIHELLLGRIGAQRATVDAIDMAAVIRANDVPDYDESLWVPSPTEPRSLSIPVLMYHRSGEPAERYQTPYWKFEQQLDWLQANGYETVTLAEVYAYMEGTGPLSANPVVITLDDGYGSQWEAGQALTRRGMVGVFFITTRQPRLADWQIRALAGAGHEIGAHTFSHPDLTTLSDSQLVWELSSARAELQAASGQPVDYFAYPYGAYNNRVIAATQAAGYRGAVAAWGGTWWSLDKRWVEPRIEVSGYLSLGEFAALVQ